MTCRLHADTFRWPLFGTGIAQRVLQLIAKPGLADSETVDTFEAALARWLGVRYALTQSCGTMALESALFAVGVGPDTEVIGPDLSYWGCVLPATRLGANIVLADCAPGRVTISLTAVEAAITERTKAVVAVHLHGDYAPVDELKTLCRPRGIAVIEDASHTVGSVVKNQRAGSLGDISIFSLNGKVFCAGEGGVATTNDEALYRRMVRWGLADRGTSFDDPLSDYRGVSIGGVSARIANITAALGLEQLTQIDRAMAEITTAMSGLLARLDPHGLRPVPLEQGVCRGAWHECLMQIEGLDHSALERVAHDCRTEGLNVITLRKARPPLHLHPWFQPDAAHPPSISAFAPTLAARAAFPNAEAANGLILPRPTRHRPGELDLIADILSGAVARAQR